MIGSEIKGGLVSNTKITMPKNKIMMIRNLEHRNSSIDDGNLAL